MKSIRKFMFVVPNTRWFDKRCWMWFVPGVVILTSILKRYGIDVEIVEGNIDNLSPEEVRERIRTGTPDVVGLSNMSIEYWRQLHECARLTKEVDKNIITIAGGAHPTTLPEKVMEDLNIDFVILNEGEERLIKLLDIIQNNNPDFTKMDGILYRDNGVVVKQESCSWVWDLDSVPLPDYTIFDNYEKVMNFSQSAAGGVGTRRTPVAAMITSRGCPFICNFCAGFINLGRKMRYRSPENVLKEVDILVKKFGVKEIVFQDDEMYANKNRAREIIQGIKYRKYDLIWKNTNLASWRMDYELIQLMAESGCYQITISPESGNPRVLKEIIHKPIKLDDALNISRWCKEFGIELQADFIIGFPGETWDEIRDTTNFAEELDADSVKFAVATPFPGTELYRTAVERGLFPKDYDFYTDHYLGFANPTMDTEHFSMQDLKMLRVLEWDRINFKTQQKKARYAKVNGLTLEQLEDFRRQTRRNLGLYFVDQAESERNNVIDQAANKGKRFLKTAETIATLERQSHHEVI